MEITRLSQFSSLSKETPTTSEELLFRDSVDEDSRRKVGLFFFCYSVQNPIFEALRRVEYISK